MALFRRLFGRKVTNLVTGIAEREQGVWRITWASDGATPPEFSGDNLTSVTERAAAAVASMYVDSPEASEAELQFAIYPWIGKPGKVILDIQRSADGFAAEDIQGSGVTVHGSSLEELVQEAERRLPNTQEAMFRWIRLVSQL
jgi:hypothetical protein